MNREYEQYAHHFGDQLKAIPLPTKHTYEIDVFGNVFRAKHRLKGWLHESVRKGNKLYRRYGLVMKDGSVKKFYAHRLMGFAYLGLKEGDGRIVCHDTPDGLFNYVGSLRLGTIKENQSIDRLESGTYFNRGKNGGG